MGLPLAVSALPASQPCSFPLTDTVACFGAQPQPGKQIPRRIPATGRYAVPIFSANPRRWPPSVTLCNGAYQLTEGGIAMILHVVN